MKDYLGKKSQTVQEKEKIDDIFDLLSQDNLDFITVLDETNKPVGIISAQMMAAFQKARGYCIDKKVGEFSSKDYVVLSKEDTIDKAIEHYEKPILIIDRNNQFIGILDKSKMLKDYFEKQQLLANELAAILDFAHEGIVVTDKKGYITMMNEPYAEFLGVKKEEVIGKHVTEIIDGTRLHIVAATGKQEIGDIQRIRGKNIVVMRMPILKNGQVSGAIGKIMFKDPKEVSVLASKITKIEKELNYYKDALGQASSARYSFSNIIGISEKLQESKYLAEKAAHTNSNVLIRGESGTGKELFAHAIHSCSYRSPKPFVKINCAAIPAELLESELFGYEEGAFTGARRGGKIGKFESANGGSIFLDEIGDMPLAMQAKLLRVLQEKEIERVGGVKNIEVDVRIIAATHRNLEEMVEKGEFREDLYYRLNVMNIQIPSLRERPEDIPMIVRHLLEKISEQVGNYVSGISQDAMNRLGQYNWPGNVRELENVLERTIILVDYAGEIKETHLPMYLRKAEKSRFSQQGKDLKEILADAERDAILDCLHQTGGNRSETAKILKISRSSLYERLWKYGIE
ncbi:sigma-54-dependent Fis family transcriptional regulator [Geosporobacter ferrireducens]|uniref:sigma-54-dependent Fis family transcriptional regulator n=1 Tax=Geosporobacter ferrireducens TaxID=1424294 RepID=UPI001EFFE6FB|nr:sigma 54-interacting transcriptional regulator [Geosporobacter ferrireducens]